MKCLTISQPFASLIVSGEKFVENRTWRTNYRGPLLIHAGAGSRYLRKAQLSAYPCGFVLGKTCLVGCYSLDHIQRAGAATPDDMVPGSRLSWRALVEHKHTEGPWCWVLGDVRPLAIALPWKGFQGLFEFPDVALFGLEFLDPV